MVNHGPTNDYVRLANVLTGPVNWPANDQFRATNRQFDPANDQIS